MQNQTEVQEKVLQETLPSPLRQSTHELVATLYRDDTGSPFNMTPTQEVIFNCIFQKQAPDGRRRVHIETYTQYGKSEVVSMAVLTRVATYPEKWVIVAPSQSKARIIISSIIKHCFDNEYTMERLKIDEGESLDHLRRERSKNRLTFNTGNNQMGEVFILSADSRLQNSEEIGNSLMGYGSPCVIEDEAALIDDEADAKAIRMVGGFSAENLDFVVKIGNPFKRNHFLKSFLDPEYFKVKVDYRLGIKEKRISQKFVEEMRDKPGFDTLYECTFPEEDTVDAKGWAPMFSEKEIQSAMLAEGEVEPQHVGEKRLGVDVARGGANLTVFTLRSMHYMEIIRKSKQNNLSEIASNILFEVKNRDISYRNLFIDEIGVGGGVVDPLRFQNLPVQGVNVGREALDSTHYTNLRAESYFRLREWIKKGGRLSRDDDWFQLTKIKWKPDAKGRSQIMSKDMMRSYGIDSPDCADSAMLGFTRRETAVSEEHRIRERLKKNVVSSGRGLKLFMAGY